MNRSIPKLGTRNTSALTSFTHLALPIRVSEERAEINLPTTLLREIESLASCDLAHEIEKAGTSFAGKVGEVYEIFLSPLKKSKLQRVLLVGVGEGSPSDMRKAGVAVGRKIKGTGSSLFSFVPTTKENALTHLLALGLSTYTWSEKSGKTPETPDFFIDEKFDDVIAKAEILLEGTWRARDLIHTPANIATPEWIANQAKKIAREAGLTIRIRGGKEISEFGGLRAVGNSSLVHPPRFVEVTYSPKISNLKAKRKVKHVVLVGKGITFDTGGYALKPREGMVTMKCDMSGAATVIAAAIAIAQLKLPIEIHAWAALAENMVSDTATRPSDIITIYGGKTVEVLNPDAEGRLILADGLVRATEVGKKAGGLDGIIDVATLTGAQVVALGTRTSAAMTNNDEFREKFLTVASQTGEAFWPMPLPEELRASLDSPVADIANIGERMGGMLVAGLFLKDFVDPEIPWLHLDIAGPAYNESQAHGYTPVGGTGVALRTLVAFAQATSTR